VSQRDVARQETARPGTRRKRYAPAMSVYDLAPVRLPRLAGSTFALFVRLLETAFPGRLLVGKTLSDMGVPALRSLVVDEPPSFLPAWPAPPAAGPEPPPSLPPWGEGTRAGFLAPSAEDFVEAYRSGRTTPEAVAERALTAIVASDRAAPALRAFVAVRRDDVMTLARASTARWKEGSPLGPLDGVPVGVKDELDVAGYPTTVGTSFLGREVSRDDATAAARLRAAGAVILGKTNMHEIGIGVTGFNTPHGTARNPHAPGHYTGGSSSGSAAAVAAGLCPIAVGADAGGSIRIPSTLCGVVGLKPTFGRVSGRGAAPLAWSLDHYGPIAVCARDAALAYAAMAGVDPADPLTRGTPQVSLDGLETGDLSGLTLGIFRPWFDDAEPGVVRVCRALVDRLAERGARVVEVELPDLGAARLSHLVLVAGEMATAMEPYRAGHGRELGLDVRANLALARAFTARDYVKAQRVRTRVMERFRRAFETVDAIVTPGTGVAAPAIRPDVLPRGESDLTMLLAIMRFAFPSNLTGHPAIAFPAGYAEGGLPVGLQAIGRPWHEHVLLRIARVAETLVERRRPKVFHDLLGG